MMVSLLIVQDLGIIYTQLAPSDPWKYLHRAIVHYSDAILIFTKATYPADGAKACFNLALVRAELGNWKGARADMVRARESYLLAVQQEQAQKADEWLRQVDAATPTSSGFRAWLRRIIGGSFLLG